MRESAPANDEQAEGPNNNTAEQMKAIKERLESS
jgi:hypothetical protein